VKPPKGVPRDEWLLAIGLANLKFDARDAEIKLARAISPRMKSTAFLFPTSAGGGAFEGVCDVTVKDRPFQVKSVNLDAYAAGAALAIALESP
jgi:hypothetical protein